MVAPEEMLGIQRRRIRNLVMALPDSALRTPVPACPGWTVHDLVAHLAGNATDMATDMATGTAAAGHRTDARTAHHVSERRDRPVDQLLAEWDRHASHLESSTDTWSPVGIWLLYDSVIHEDDLRDALGAAPATDSPAYHPLLEGLIDTADRALRQAGVQALTIGTTDGAHRWTVGPGPAGAAVHTETHELVRGLSGRRSLQALTTWDWDGDSGPYLRLLPALP